MTIYNHKQRVAAERNWRIAIGVCQLGLVACVGALIVLLASVLGA